MSHYGEPQRQSSGRDASNRAEENPMYQSIHDRAAEYHNLAAHAHAAAAASHGTGALTAHELSRQAHEHSTRAFAESKRAAETHGESAAEFARK